MELLIIYILMFCIGTVFGSFFTLAVYRIPLHQDITHERSYCPNCNHKLSFFDMIPILSYIFLGGKCRYCKTKIRIRYLILEIMTGLLFLVWTISLNLRFDYIETSKYVYLVVGLLYLAGIVIIAGIDKEKRMISKPVLLYEIIILSIYMIYLYVVEKNNIYRYVIYLIITSVLLFINNRYYKKRLTDNYPIDICILCICMALFGTEIPFFITVIFTLLTISIYILCSKVKSKLNKCLKKDENCSNNLPIGFYLCCSNVIVLLCINYLACRW